MADVTYVRHRPAEYRAFQSATGTTGRWVTKKTAEVAAHAITFAPKPGQSRGYATGELARKIKPGRTVADRTGPESTVDSGAEHSIFVHQGTEPHVIRPRRPNKIMVFRGRMGQAIRTDLVRHPGTAANKFLTKALRAVFGSGR